MFRLGPMLLLAVLLAACSRETTVVTATDAPAPAPVVVAESSTPQPIETSSSPAPFIEPVPTQEFPSIMRRDAQPAAVPMEVTPDFPRRITPGELKSMLDQGTAVVIDVRSEEYFRQRHIPGSLNIPVHEVVLRANEIPEGKTAVAVCT